MAAIQDTSLEALIAERAAIALDPAVMRICEAAREEFGAGVAAVLAYGSCLRDGAVADGLVDLYVLGDAETGLAQSALSRHANRALPPNVYYLETAWQGEITRAKVATLALAQFETKVTRATANPYFWARFAQPSAIAYARDDEVRNRLVASFAAATDTFLATAQALSAGSGRTPDLWVNGLRATYATELRPEAASRAETIVAADRAYYDAIGEAWRSLDRPPMRAPNWTIRRLIGKALSIARLIKAGFTFQGGADYIAWKIARHSQVEIEVKPWHRRHPVLAAIALAPHLYRKGGFR